MRAIATATRLLLAGPLAAACLQVSTGTDTGPGASAGGGTSAAPTSSGSATTGGTGCVPDPQFGVVLCAALDACSGVTVDPNAFPNCGFARHGGGTLDLECVCGDSLCPIGVPQTCAQAAQLLTSQTLLLVCQQASDGRCVQLTAPDAGSSDSSSCLQQCRSDCAGVPNCMNLCGC